MIVFCPCVPRECTIAKLVLCVSLVQAATAVARATLALSCFTAHLLVLVVPRELLERGHWLIHEETGVVEHRAASGATEDGLLHQVWAAGMVDETCHVTEFVRVARQMLCVYGEVFRIRCRPRWNRAQRSARQCLFMRIYRWGQPEDYAFLDDLRLP